MNQNLNFPIEVRGDGNSDEFKNFWMKYLATGKESWPPRSSLEARSTKVLITHFEKKELKLNS